MPTIEEMLGVSPTEKTQESFSFKSNKQDTSSPLWQKVRDGDKTAQSAFLKEMDSTISKALHSFAQDDSQYKTKARLLALDAANSYDPNKGADIKTHVYNNLKRLQRLTAQRGNLTKIPENAALQLSQVNRAIREFEVDHGTTPTTEELADLTGFSAGRIDALTHFKPVVPDSITVSPEGDSLVENKFDKSLDLYNKYIYNDLDRIDKKIYEWSTGYGLNKKLSGVEIAKKLKISPAAVSKRYTNIAKKFAADRDLLRSMFQ